MSTGSGHVKRRSLPPGSGESKTRSTHRRVEFSLSFINFSQVVKQLYLCQKSNPANQKSPRTITLHENDARNIVLLRGSFSSTRKERNIMSTTKRVALVTGAMGGLGTAICQALAKEGFVVVANCLPGEPTKDVWLKQAAKDGLVFSVVEGDVSDFASCERMVAEVEQTVGPVDVLVNNAGITRDGRYYKMKQCDFDLVMKVNFYSVFNMTQQVLPGMVTRGFGRIINMSSVNGVKGQDGQGNYAAAKEIGRASCRE